MPLALLAAARLVFSDFFPPPKSLPLYLVILASILSARFGSGNSDLKKIFICGGGVPSVKVPSRTPPPFPFGHFFFFPADLSLSTDDASFFTVSPHLVQRIFAID